MTPREQALIAHINRLTMMVFLQEMRAQVLRRQVVEANAVIVKATETVKQLTEAVFGQLEHYDTTETRIV